MALILIWLVCSPTAMKPTAFFCVNPCQYPRLSASTINPLLHAVYRRELKTAENETTVIRKEPDSWLAEDKLLHFAVSLALVGSSYHFIHCRLAEPEDRATVFSLGFSLGLGLSKEVYDSKKPYGRFSYKDLIYDILGISAGYLLFIHQFR